MKTSILSLAALAASTAAFGTVTTNSTDNTITMDVPAGGVESCKFVLNSNPYATCTLVKTGGGAFTMTYNDNKYFGGKIEVRSGTLKPGAGNKTYGKPTAVTVSDGGTLFLAGSEGGYFHEKSTVLSLAGRGANDAGALCANNSGTAMLSNLKLTDDALIKTETGGSAMRFYGYLSGKFRTFDLGGHVLEIAGLGQVSFRAGSFVTEGNGGVKVSGGRVNFEQDSGNRVAFAGDSGNVLEVCGGATNNLMAIAPSPWTMKYTGSTASCLLNTAAAATNVWEGPLVVMGVLRAEITNAASAVRFAGPVTTSATIALTDRNRGTLLFTGDDPKTFDGRFAVSGGRVEFNGTKNVNLNEASDMNAVSGASSALAFIDAGVVSNKSYNLRVYGDTVDRASRLIVSGGTTFPVTTAQIGEASSYGTDTRYGIVEVGPGAEIHNALGIGEDGYEIMSVYQRGGYWQLPSGGGNLKARAPIGHSAMGYYELAGGTFRTFGGSAALTIGNNAAGEGAFAMAGGVFQSGDLTVGNSGDGLWYQTGGTATVSPGTSTAGDLLVAKSSGAGQFTLAGPTARMNLTSGTYGTDLVAGSASAASVAVVNLNAGGRLAYRKLHKAADASADARFYLNFDGGVLEPRNCWQAIGEDDAATGKTTATQRPDAVTIYGGGLTIDISKALNGQKTPDTTYLDCDLTAPAGGSVVAVEVPDSVKAARYIHRPRVYIEGDGQGASAVADFDSAAGRVRGVIVTSPGFGYTAATCKIAGNAFQKQADRRANAVACAVTIGFARGGGVRMVGAGNRLNLSGSNTYAGVTTCENGSLRFASHAAHPAGGGLAVWKGADFASYIKLPGAAAVTAGSLAGDGRIVCGNVVGVTNIVAEAARVFAAGASPLTVDDRDESGALQSGCGSVTLAENATVTVNGMRDLIDAAGGVDAFLATMRGAKLLVAKAGLNGSVRSVEMPGLTADEAGRFKVSVVGNAVRLGRDIGMTLILR